MEYIQSEELKENNRLYREMDRLYHEVCVRLGMSDSAFWVLYCIAEMGEECSQKSISQRYHISLQTVNSSVKKLKEAGKVVLKAGKGHDKRIVLTEPGRQLMREKIFRVMEMENEVFSEMPDEEVKELLRLNGKYAELFRRKVEAMESNADSII